jgi:hypothetical protein
VGRGISAVGRVLRQEADFMTESVGLLVQQGAGQTRERQGAARAN